MPEPRLTGEQDDQLRRLLRQARHDEPIPDDVAQRLDRVLAGLRAEVAAPAPVADLGAARDRGRRRRTATTLLVAAAAVVVAGVGIGHLVSRSSSGDDSSADSSVAVDRGSSDSGGAAAPSAEASDGVAPSGSPFASGSPRSALPYQQFKARLPVPLSSTSLRRDVRRAATLAARARLQPGIGAIRTPVDGWTCPDVTTFAVSGDAEQALPATYDGRSVLLVLGPTDTGRQQATVLACGSFTTLRQVVVPGS